MNISRTTPFAFNLFSKSKGPIVVLADLSSILFFVLKKIWEKSKAA